MLYGRMRIAVMGTGGIGGYFGARLARAGETVGFVARGGHLRAIERDGLAVRSMKRLSPAAAAFVAVAQQHARRR